MKKFLAFTLAEVLIVLGIIGIIAELTLPDLMNNFQKQATITKLKKAYSTLYQAVRLSEIDNGDVTQWDFGTKKDGNATLTWFKTYLAPYMKYTKAGLSTSADGIEIWSESADVYLQDGTIITLWNNDDGTQMHAFVKLDGLKSPWTYGKNGFIFFIGPPPPSHGGNYGSPFINKEIRAYDYRDSNCTGSDPRTFWTCDPTYGCSKTALKHNCTGLIMYDNWQIKDDYPYFN